MIEVYHVTKKYGLFKAVDDLSLTANNGRITIRLDVYKRQLLCLPNACYMVTDLIHLQGSQLIGGNGVYLQSLSGWVRLIYIVGGILMALVDGLFSTSLIHQNVKWRRNKVFTF